MGSWSQLWGFAVVLLAMVGCNPLWGIDELRYDLADAASGAAGASTSATGGNHAGGGGEGGAGAAPLQISQLWSKRFGEDGKQLGQQLAIDKDSNIVLGGSMFGTLSAGGQALTSAGSTDLLVMKLDPSGQPLWAKRFGDADEQSLRGLAVDGDGNIVVVGHYQGTIAFGGDNATVSSTIERDMFLAKLTPQGAPLWVASFGGDGGQYGYDIVVTKNDDLVIVGTFEASVSFGGSKLVSAGDNDILVACFDSTGAHKWSKRFGDALEQKANDVAVDASGNVLLSGYVRGGVDFGGGTLAGGDNHDAFIAKLDSSGGHLWSKRFGDFAEQNVWDIAVDGAGNVTITGDFMGSVDFGGGALSSAGDRDVYLARFDSNGEHLWSKRFGDSMAQRGLALDVDAAGRTLLIGDFAGSVDLGVGAMTSMGNTDVLLAAFGPNGQPLGSERYGDSEAQTGKAAVFNNTKSALLLGDFSGSIDFGGGPLMSGGATDVFVAKLGYE